MFVLNNKTVLQPGKSWQDENGLTHPGNWASAWSAEEKTAYGIKEVAIQAVLVNPSSVVPITQVSSR